MERELAELQRLARELEGTIPPLLEIGQVRLASAAKKELGMINEEIDALRAEIAQIKSKLKSPER